MLLGQESERIKAFPIMELSMMFRVREVDEFCSSHAQQVYGCAPTYGLMEADGHSSTFLLVVCEHGFIVFVAAHKN